ncbi:hypothetical protein SAMN05216368_102168 [Cryobacterium flavum]|uniref:Uncharacterized protein n=1 Tax=Cryobacterium flavum TaxID=1424659 RepID=A0A5E9FVW6_9MICO|nr:hypothetical protein SAMN05216368_102168 [Cryobacterium flavum]
MLENLAGLLSYQVLDTSTPRVLLDPVQLREECENHQGVGKLWANPVNSEKHTTQSVLETNSDQEF